MKFVGELLFFWMPWAFGFPLVMLCFFELAMEAVFCVQWAIYQQRFNTREGVSKRLRFGKFWFDLRTSFGKRRGLRHNMRRR